MKLIYLLPLVFIGCNPKKAPAKQVILDPSPVHVSLDTPKTTTINSDSPDQEKLLTAYEIEACERLKKIKSYAQFLRYYFMIGSTENQVRKVQGSPDDISSLNSNTEVWFYGQCEVTLQDGKVSKINNPSGCLNYLDPTIGMNSCGSYEAWINANQIIGDMARSQTAIIK